MGHKTPAPGSCPQVIILGCLCLKNGTFFPVYTVINAPLHKTDQFVSKMKPKNRTEHGGVHKCFQTFFHALIVNF